MSVVRVLIADDHDEFRSALHDLVEETPGFLLVAEADSGEAAIAAAATAHPDLVLIDVRMPGIGGLGAAERIVAASPQTTVVMLTADSGGLIVEPERFTVMNKRSLGPAKLVELWDSSRHR